MSVQLYDLPASIITETTIKKMHELVRKAKTDYTFINLIRWIVLNDKVPSKDYMGELKAVYKAWKKYVRYFFDPDNVELVQGIWRILKNRAGDCDCLTVLMSASMGAIGHKYRFLTIKADPRRPNEWSHIFPEIYIPQYGWTPADLSVPEATVGWKPQGYPEKIWDKPVY